MFEVIILIGCAAIAGIIALRFSRKRSSHRHHVDPVKLTAELRYLGESRQSDEWTDPDAGDEKTVSDAEAPDKTPADKTRSLQPKAEASQPASDIAPSELEIARELFVSDPTVRVPEPQPESPSAQPDEEVPDEIYLLDAHIGGIKTGDAYPAFARMKYLSGAYPIPNDVQMARLVATLDAAASNAVAYRQTPPIAVIRKARLASDVTHGRTSWLGGRPRLGDADWPRNSAGTPMHHWASIDLAELPALETPADLPDEGTLLFFVEAIDPPYDGRVLYITGQHPETTPPEDLPIIDHRSTFMFGSADYPQAEAPSEHPHWDVAFMPLPMDQTSTGYAKARAVMEDAFPQTSNFTLSTLNLGEIYLAEAGVTPWASVQRFHDKMMGHEAALKEHDCLSDFQKFLANLKVWIGTRHPWDLLTDAERSEFDDLRSWSLPLRDDLPAMASYVIRSCNQAVETFAEDVVGTFQDLLDDWDAQIASVPDEIRMVAEAYRDITAPFLWDTAQRCAVRAAAALNHIDETLQNARKDVEGGKIDAKQRLAYLEANVGTLRTYIDEFQAFAEPNERWTHLTAEDRVHLNGFIAQVAPNGKGNFGLLDYYLAKDAGIHLALRDACNATLRHVASGDESLYQLIPETLKAIIDKAHQLPERFRWHQMFGEGISQQVGREDHPHDHLLLQLVSDPMMKGAWGKGGAVVQFWISPADLERQNWGDVSVTLEGD